MIKSDDYLFCRAVVYVARYLAAFLPTTHQMPITSLPQLWQSKMSLDIAKCHMEAKSPGGESLLHSSENKRLKTIQNKMDEFYKYNDNWKKSDTKRVLGVWFHIYGLQKQGTLIYSVRNQDILERMGIAWRKKNEVCDYGYILIFRSGKWLQRCAQLLKIQKAIHCLEVSLCIVHCNKNLLKINWIDEWMNAVSFETYLAKCQIWT